MDDNVIPFERRTAPLPPDDFATEDALYMCEEMLKLVSDTMSSIEASAFATQLFIHLHDLAQSANKLGKRITFNDNIELIDGIKDITDLVSKLRNGVCHIRSHSLNIGEGAFVFNRFIGYAPSAFVIVGRAIGCDFSDDMAIYFGPYRFYVKRHGSKLLNELRIAHARSIS